MYTGHTPFSKSIVIFRHVWALGQFGVRGYIRSEICASPFVETLVGRLLCDLFDHLSGGGVDMVLAT